MRTAQAATIKRVKMDRLSGSRRFGTYDREKITFYREALRRREKLRPVDVENFADGLRIFDGYHRFRAHRLEGRKTILVRYMFA